MLAQLVYLLAICIVVAIVFWICDYLPVPEPLNKLVKVISVIVGVVAVLIVLFRLAGVAIPA